MVIPPLTHCPYLWSKWVFSVTQLPLHGKMMFFCWVNESSERLKNLPMEKFYCFLPITPTPSVSFYLPTYVGTSMIITFVPLSLSLSLSGLITLYNFNYLWFPITFFSFAEIEIYLFVSISLSLSLFLFLLVWIIWCELIEIEVDQRQHRCCDSKIL